MALGGEDEIKYPYRPPTMAMPYVGIENLRPGTQTLLRIFAMSIPRKKKVMETKMHRIGKAATVLTLVFVAATSIAGAQEKSNEWEFQLAPLYLWAMSIDGTMTIRERVGGDFEVDVKDALDNLEAGFTVHFEARKGRWGLLADANYLKLAGSKEINTPAGSVEAEVKNLILDGGFGYEFANQWWVIAGVRYYELDTKIAFELAPSLEPS